jgi:hypothetical protein
MVPRLPAVLATHPYMKRWLGIGEAVDLGKDNLLKGSQAKRMG